MMIEEVEGIEQRAETPKDIAIHMQDAVYLISRENAEQFLKLLLPGFLKGEESNEPGMSFLQNAIKGFLGMNLPSRLKKKYGEKWYDHRPPKHTDLLQWTLNDLVADTITALGSAEWRMHVESDDGDSDRSVYRVRGITAVAPGGTQGKHSGDQNRPAQP